MKRLFNKMILSAFSAAFLIASFVGDAVAQTGAAKTQSQLNTEIGSPSCSQPTCLFPDNITEQITPFILRQGLLDMAATMYAPNGPVTISTGPLTINPTSGTSNQGFAVTQTGINSGSQGSTQLNYNSIIVSDGANLSGGAYSTALLVQQNLQSNILGQKAAIYAISTRNSSATSTTGDQIGITSFVQSQVSNGGTNTGAGASGSMYGINPIINTSAGATNYKIVAGGELDLQTSGTTQNRVGLAVVSAGSGTGAQIDTALDIAATAGSWGNVILLEKNIRSGIAPVGTGGCIICTDGNAFTITTFADLSAYTISGNILNFANYVVAGSGQTTITRAPSSNTPIDGLRLQDTTTASSGNQQYSPSVHFSGQGWKTNATAASQSVDMYAYAVPVQGASAPGAQLNLDAQIAGGSQFTIWTLSTDINSGGNTAGILNGVTTSQLELNVNGSTVGNLFANASLVQVGSITNVPVRVLVNNANIAQFNSNANNGITFTNYGLGLLHSSAGGVLTSSLVVSADLNITTTTCTNQFLTAISATGIGTCTTTTLASAQFANQGTTTTVLHGNAAGNPSFTAVSLTADVSGTLPVANGGTNYTGGAWTSFTSTATPGAGSITTQSSNSSFLQIGKIVFVQIGVSISNVGTASGNLTLSLPVQTASGAGNQNISCRESGLTGKMSSGVAAAGTTNATVLVYDNTNYTYTNGLSLQCGGVYQAN